MRRIIYAFTAIAALMLIAVPAEAKGPKGGGGPKGNNGNHYGWYKQGAPIPIGVSPYYSYRPYYSYPNGYYYPPVVANPSYFGYYTPNYGYYGPSDYYWFGY